MYIKKLFKQSPRILYSCVIDNTPKFYWQGFIFVTSLIEIAKIEPKNIYIHMIERNHAFELFLDKKGVNKIFIHPWGDNKYCNKLQQIETVEFQHADYVFLCDADIVFADNISKIINFDNVMGKTVDLNNPEIEKLKFLFDYFKLAYPFVNTETLNKLPTLDGNFNGGLYGIPGKHITNFGNRWKYWAEKLLKSDTCSVILGKRSIHIDQISFCMTLQDLKHPYNKLDIAYNCPTNDICINFLPKLVKTEPLVLHYHSKLSPVGLLEKTNVEIIDKSINKVNNVLKESFNNELFWNYRYDVNPILGSGIGSRGETALHKLLILKCIGIENDTKILDVGCGDLEIIQQLNLSKYTGVDLSDEALKLAKNKLPNSEFYHLKRDKDKILKADTVLCLDVLIHQQSKKDYYNLLNFLADKTNKRLIISGYRNNADQSHMCFFHEDVVTSLQKLKIFKYIFSIGTYRNLDVIIADKGELGKHQEQYPNDINNEDISIMLKKYPNINNELLFEVISTSRGLFGWYTKHLPRLYEYPWLLARVGTSLKEKVIADFGAGITPLPYLLSLRGAKVITIDNNKINRALSNIQQANEWGYFDYSQASFDIESLNNNLTDVTFPKNHIDIWYSISVVEHMPADTRRKLFSIMYNNLKQNGKLLLTVDLEKNSNKLWNRSSGKQVEDPMKHGTLDSIASELKSLGFIHIEIDSVSMPDSENVDIAMISAEVNK